MSNGGRKWLLIAHVATSVGLLEAVGAFLMLAVAGLASTDDRIVRAAYIAMNLIAETVVLPLAGASLAIGVAGSLATPWGLFRHYWILAKLVLTALALGVLLLQMPRIGLMAEAAPSTNLYAADFPEDRLALALHAARGLLVLLALSIAKPQGMTRYGQRKRFDQAATRVGVVKDATSA